MGQTEITGHCSGLMCRNGEQNVVDFTCVESRHLLYARSRRLLLNLANMHRKPLACFSLHVDMVPMAYQ
jgi:hypothetical protein